MLAAVDLGSNSFRMVIARVVGAELRLVDRLREGVRLAECLDRDQRLNAEGRRRALACLRRFGQRLRDFPRGSVRAVGTNTLRKARNTEKFLLRAEEALGHPIEVVSGQEEARLIYLGACHSLSGAGQRRLVVDVGGGSTECIAGDGFEPLRTESLYMGCVSYTLEYFPKGKISRKRMRKAETAARLEMRPVKAEFRQIGWQRAVGSSGTVLAIDQILHLNGWSEQGITPEGLARLRRAVLEVDHVDRLSLKGLRNERAKVLPGGLAILSAVFDSLKVERMSVSPGAMREGVLYDLLGRHRHEDVRDRTIQRFLEQYHVDVAQARRVEATALRALDQVAEAWKLDPATSRQLLAWGASLHEIGLSVAHGGYHKHGAYLIYHSNMPGFSFQDQRTLSLLVRGIRRKLRKSQFKNGLVKSRAKVAIRLCILLRLAVLLNRSRSRRPLPDFRLVVKKKKKLRIELPQGWLDEHPLTRADLQQEVAYLEAAGFRLKVAVRG
jgi:exopolyphosphatase/guanosine-5'-triphosphate,3'-diphosphate pyrophosphatase